MGHAIGTEATVLFRMPTSFLSAIPCRYSVTVHISVSLLSPIFIEIHYTYFPFYIPARQAPDNTAQTPLCQDVTRDAIHKSRFLNTKCSQSYTVHVTRFTRNIRYNTRVHYKQFFYLSNLSHGRLSLNSRSLCFRSFESEQEV
jgi:hypothetical protein